MKAHETTGSDEVLRRRIAELVSAERRTRVLPQTTLAAELGVSQAHLSNVERGRASFTAEQFLYLVQRFNLSLETFLPVVDDDAAVQNALLHHGAWHLAQVPSAGAPRYANVNELIVRVLRVPLPRHVAALLPVVLHRVRELSLPAVRDGLDHAHVAHRLEWLLDVIEHALAKKPLPETYVLPAREVRMVISLVRDSTEPDVVRGPDVLDLAIRSVETARELLATGDPIARKHNIATSLTVAYFVDAMNHAALAHP